MGTRRRPALLLLLIAAAQAVFVSLFLPWQEPVHTGSPLDGLSEVAGIRVYGWNTGLGAEAALLALLLAGASAAACVRQELIERLRIAPLAAVVGYVTLANAAAARSQAGLFVSQFKIPHHAAVGTYLGVAAGVSGVVLGAALSGRLALTRPSAGAVLAIGLLVSLLLPWESSTQYKLTYPAVVLTAGQAAAGTTLALLLFARSGARRVFIAAVSALLAAAAFDFANYVEASRTPAAWIGVALAFSVLVVTIVQHGMHRAVRLTSWPVRAQAACAGLLVVALFLPLYRTCQSGDCASQSSWSTSLGVSAGLLGLAIVATRAMRVVLATGALVCTATLWIAIRATRSGGYTFERGRGVDLALAAAILLLITVIARAGRPAWREVATLRIIPLAVCVTYALIVVLPWSYRLPGGAQESLRFSSPDWLMIASVVLVFWLTQLWLESSTRPLAVVPLAMLVLVGVDLLHAQQVADSLPVNWGRVLVPVLCLVLAALGRIEERGGLAAARVPEALRIDRIQI